MAGHHHCHGLNSEGLLPLLKARLHTGQVKRGDGAIRVDTERRYSVLGIIRPKGARFTRFCFYKNEGVHCYENPTGRAGKIVINFRHVMAPGPGFWRKRS